MRRALQLLGTGIVVSLVAAACMSRPVTTIEPQTSNLYVEPIRNDVIDKIDLLFMIDNSRSMGDKQKLLATAVPQLVDRLVVPRCVSGAGAIHQRASLDEACPAGSSPEFQAVKDIHVAVITSSLGAHGAANSSCSGTSPDHDRALLLPSVRPDLNSYANSGFLAWDPEQELMPPGEGDRARLGTHFSDMVRAAGEQGCGFEASLESWYRFLIDPEPPVDITRGEDGRSVAGAVDQDLLAQRKAFLRHDSLVAIVMLTDENDCSVRDDEFGHFLANGNGNFNMPRGSSACERDPNDPCCLPCTLTGPVPQGCEPIASDAACQRGTTLSDAEDPPNLRCFENKRRFGYDFLHPTSRYVRGLTEPEVPQRSTGGMTENPLFAAPPGQPRRSRDLVYLAGIVGVPWQDIADDASRMGEGLRYLTASELQAKDRWATIVGDPARNLKPTDPFMHEATAPRSGINPITDDPIVVETSLNPRANAINGHEQIDLDGTDLQYACTFALTQPEECVSDSCDCQADENPDPNVKDDLDRNRPLCQPPTGGAASTTQYFGKAYPGLRPLEVLRGVGDSAIVASICPKVLEPGRPGYGYEPAVDAIVDRLKVVLNGRCPPRPLAVKPESGGQLPCVVVEAAPNEGAACSCSAAQRGPASAEAERMVKKQLRERGQCGVADAPSCESFCFCELAQAEGDNLNLCLNDELGSDTPGYCYVDPFGNPPVGNPALVADCGSSPRKIRFVGPETPTPGASAFIACLGATLH